MEIHAFNLLRRPMAGALCLCLSVVMAMAAAAERAVPERWEFHFDARAWKLGFQDANRLQEIREYVLHGEEVENWSELVTSFYSKGRVPVRSVYEQTLGSLSRDCASFTTAVIRESADDIVYEWRHQGCQGFPAQHQLSRLTADKKGMHSLSFVEKTGELTAEKRDIWIAILQAATLRAEP